MVEVKAWTVAELITRLATCQPDALVYVSTENHTEPLASMSGYASGAVGLDGGGDTNYAHGGMPPNE